MTESKRKPWIRWVVIGCSGLLLLVVVGVASIVSLVMGSIKKSGAFQEALEKARSHPAAVAALGEPIVSGFFITGSIHVEGSSGEANLSIPLRGPRGKGTLYVEATKRADRWEFALLELEVTGQVERIDIRAIE